MAKKAKEFLVSVADVAFYVNDTLAFTGTTSLNTSIAVSVEDSTVTGGKGDKTLYKIKYGRKLAPSIEMAEWKMAYIAANLGSSIFTGLADVFSVAECVQLVNGVGTTAHTPIGKVSVEKNDGTIVEVTPVGSTITVGSETETVTVTYQYNTNVKRVTVDADSTPMIGRLVLTAEKHNNSVGKIGEIQIEVPSFQLSGNFDISLEASGASTTKLEGDALAVDGDTCSSGSVYAYISEIEDNASSVAVSDIVATPAQISIGDSDTKAISVIGLIGGLNAPISIASADCVFASDTPSVATVDLDGVVEGVSTGTAIITVTYDNTKTDIVSVTVA